MSPVSHHTFSHLPQPTVSVVIVGQTQLVLFQHLLTSLRNDPTVRVLAECETIADALEVLPVSQAAVGLSVSPAGPRTEVDLVVVLQSHSDEYGTLDVQLLIGRMLFGRVICCYGPWCLADGRTHTIWPVSCRVAVASAPVLLGAEFAAVRQQRPPLSPMSAAEEVFVHRNLQHAKFAEWGRRDFCVVSNDRVLRTSAGQLCMELCDELQPGEHPDTTVQTTSLQMAPGILQNRGDSSRPVLVLVDLDPLDEPCREFLHWLDHWLRKNAFRSMAIGVSVFAESSFALPVLSGIFDKLELSARLRELPTLSVR